MRFRGQLLRFRRYAVSPVGSREEPWPQTHFGEFLTTKTLLIAANFYNFSVRNCYEW